MTTEISGLKLVSMFSGGVGIKLADISFDYAFVPMAFLGDVSYLSISINIPSKSKPVEQQ